jgi:molybdopterin/thiamine biosynthesis adenylyltransferase
VEVEVGGIQALLSSRAKDGRLAWADEAWAAREYGMTCREVELAALAAGIVPERYLRNRETISLTDQMNLLRGHAAVIGCGGLGGYVIEELARLGVGTMTLIDPDSFEEHNLNRQILCTMDTLGLPKVEAARDRVGRINPAVEVKAVKDAFSREKGPDMLDGVQVVLDGLDSIPARLELGDVCASLHTPLVHGSVGGWYVR